MVLIFDLDDTLFEERTYVESGFRAVAEFGSLQFGWNECESLRFMLQVMDREGRGAVFDRWLEVHGRHSQTLVRSCVKCYRHHRPRIRMFRHARELLPKLSGHTLYLVTDGHKVVQQRKVEALNIEPVFRRVFITHRYGIRHAKPSTYCFERIRDIEGCEWSDLTYIGDDPAKDFVALNGKGANTVRVLTGRHRDLEALPGHDAQHRIANLGQFPRLLRGRHRPI